MKYPITEVLDDEKRLEKLLPEAGEGYLEAFRRFNIAQTEVFRYRHGKEIYRRDSLPRDLDIHKWLASFVSEDSFRQMYVSLVYNHLLEAERKEKLGSHTRRMVKKALRYSDREDLLTIFPVVVESGPYKRFALVLPDNTRVGLRYTR